MGCKLAGTIIADFIRTDANQLSLNVGNTTFATINASGFFSNTGVQIINQNGQVNGSSILSSSIPIASLGSGTILKTNMAQTSMPSNTTCQVKRLLLALTIKHQICVKSWTPLVANPQ